MKYVFPIALVIVGVVLATVYLDQNADDAPVSVPAPAQEEPAASVPSEASAASESGTYTLADVAVHADATSCWTIINGNVYDLTAWIAQHPGGSRAILSLCGRDGTATFEGQHGGQARPESSLEGFQIGLLAS